jgi:hypothetical protein
MQCTAKPYILCIGVVTVANAAAQVLQGSGFHQSYRLLGLNRLYSNHRCVSYTVHNHSVCLIVSFKYRVFCVVQLSDALQGYLT